MTRLTSSRTAALLLLFTPICASAWPDFGAIMPRGAPRGSEVAVTFSGARMEDAEEIVPYAPEHFTVSEFKVVDAANVTAKLKIAPGTPLGEHLFRVRAKSGISYARSFWVGQFPTVEEKEPNTLIEEAQAIPLNSTVAGVAENEDTDFYKVEAKKGDRISVEVEGIRLGGQFWDPYVAILNSKKFELATCDDSALLVQDSHASIMAPEDGVYYVEVRDSSYAGNGASRYRAHIGTFPRPKTVYPAGGKAGTEVEVTFLGDVGGEIKQKLAVPNTPGEKLTVLAEGNGMSSPSGHPFRISALENVLEAGPNNSHAEAKAAQTAPPAVPVAFNGIIEAKGDHDWFKFTAKKDQRFDLNVYARSIRSPLDPVLEIFNADGAGINGNDDNGANPDSKIGAWQVPADGEYYVRVRDHLERGGPEFVYRVEIAPAEPSIQAYVTRADRNDSQMWTQINLCRGNRTAALVNVDRANSGGDVIWDAQNLPQGVTMDAVPLPGNLGQYVVTFTAAADAPVGAKLASVKPKYADPNAAAIPGRWLNNIEFVQGEPNNTPYVISSQNRLAMAVTDEAPFVLDIETPKVPLVRSGTMELKVKATRKPDFKGAITVRMMWNPPGISSPGTVAIPEGQNEVVYPLTCNGDAETKTWKIAVRGEIDVGRGPLFASSTLTDLTVAPPYLTMKMEMGAVEQGKSGEILCTLEVAKQWQGPAKINIFGLPAKTTSAEKELQAGDKELRFPITTLPDSPVGKHQNLFCQAIIMENGIPIPHTIGQGGILRIDAPPPAPAKPAPMPEQPVAAAAPAAPPAAKPLSRLEQLRQQQAGK